MSVLDGRTALVTGGGRGIGAETARVLAEAGATVCVASRTMPDVVGVAAEIRDRGHEAFAFRCDVTKQREVTSLVLGVREATGRLDILVNNAGAATSNPLRKVTVDEWRRMMDVNALGPFLCTQEALEGMLEAGWGRVVNIASVAGLRGAPYVSAYTAAKHAVVGFTRAVAAEVEGTGVTVNAVCPGYVDTPLTDETVSRIASRTDLTPDEALQRLLRQAGQRRLVTPREVGGAVLDLCGPESADRNGEAVVLEGPPAAAENVAPQGAVDGEGP